MKIVTVIGARPQFIKAATISRVLQDDYKDISEVIVHTGQHYDDNMSKIFFDDLEIPKPDYNLGIGGSSHANMTGEQLVAIEKILLEEKPNLVLVYGDTNSTLSGALSSVKLHIPVAHVEAGLRSFNRKMPEEINRIVTDHTSDILFAPTEVAMNNLKNEGLEQNAFNVGDVMYDAAIFYSEKAIQGSNILNKEKLFKEEYILITIHRAENTDDKDKLEKIMKSLIELSSIKKLIFPIHPRTKKNIQNLSIYEKIVEHIQLIDPVGYMDMVMLENNASVIVTDSGGVQKEAFFHKVPCVTVRNETEWTELVELEWNNIVTEENIPNLHAICEAAIDSQGKEAYPYGKGDAAERIIKILTENI